MIAPGNNNRNRHGIYSESFTEVLTTRQTTVFKNDIDTQSMSEIGMECMFRQSQFLNLAQLSDIVHLHLGDPGSVIHIAILTGKRVDV